MDLFDDFIVTDQTEVKFNNLVKGFHFLNSTNLIHQDSFISTSFANTLIESNVARAVRKVVGDSAHRLSQNGINALSKIIREITSDNQRLVEMFGYTVVSENENELEINFQIRGFEDCNLSVYYDDDLSNETCMFLSYSRGEEDYVVNGSLTSIMTAFNRIFGETC